MAELLVRYLYYLKKKEKRPEPRPLMEDDQNKKDRFSLTITNNKLHRVADEST